MTDRATVDAWVERYVAAWDSNDPGGIRALFTPDAEVRHLPSEAPVVGHDRITADWLGARDGPGDHGFSWETLAVDGNLGVVQGRTEYTGGTDAGAVYDNLWLIRFAGGGTARAFTEWYVRRQNTQVHLRGPYVVTALLTGIDLAVSIGFTIATLASDASAASGYTLVRAVALMAVLVAVLVRRSTWALIVVGTAAAIVQAADAVIGIATGDASNTAGPAVLAALTLASTVWLARSSRAAGSPSG